MYTVGYTSPNENFEYSYHLNILPKMLEKLVLRYILRIKIQKTPFYGFYFFLTFYAYNQHICGQIGYRFHMMMS